MNLKHFQLSLVITFLLAASGCLGLKPAEDKTQFYVLSSLSRDTKPSKTGYPSIYLARMEWPAYLDNPGIAFRRGENQIQYFQQYHWAEPFHSGIERVVGEDLSALTGSDVGHRPSSRSGTNAVEVRITISRFELTDKKEALLIARWTIIPVRGEAQAIEGKAEIRKPYSKAKSDVGAGVAALSEALAEMSRQIVQQLPTLQ